MFWTLFKYNLISKSREKSSIFWTLAFPIALATLFNLAFANLNNGESFEKVNVAVVNSSSYEENFIETMTDTDLFNITETDEEAAKALLERGKVSGYIEYDNEINLTVLKKGMNETIINSFLDNYSRITATVTNVYKINPQGVTEEFMDELNSEADYITPVPVNSSNNNTVIYFYALLAMTCLMGATLGTMDVIHIQANQSQLAARLGLAPTHKLKIFLSFISATILTQFISLVIVVFYITKILKIGFGDSIGYILLLCFIGCIVGSTMGAMISSLIKKSENIKFALTMSITMVGSFLSGLMVPDIKYIIQDKIPVLSYINPANLITDAFYSLYYYDTYDRFYLNIGILTGMAAVFCAVIYFIIRRQKYESI